MQVTSTRNPWPVLAVTSLAIFAVWLDTTVLFVAFPAIQRSFPPVSAAELSWVLNGYTVMFAAMVVPAGRLADKVGRRLAFASGVALFTLASVLCGLAPSAQALIATRALQAIGAALAMPSSLAMILVAFPRDKRTVAVSLWGAVAGLSAAVGPALGAFIVQTLGWQWAFFINLPIGVAAIVLALRVATESREATTGRAVDPLGVGLVIVAIGAIVLGIVQGNAWGWASARTLGTLACGLAALAAFIAESAVSSSPVVDLALFRSRNYRYANAATLVFLIGFTAMFFGMVLFQIHVWGYSIARAGAGATPGPMVVIPVAMMSGPYAARHGHRRLLVSGGLVFAIGGAFLAFLLPTTPAYLTHFLPAAILTGLGVGLVMPSLTGAAVHGLPGDRFALGSAVNQAFRQVAAALGVAFTIALLDASHGPSGFTNVFLVVLLSGLGAALLALPIDTRSR